MDKQTKLVLQLLCVTLAVAGLCLPWLTVMSVTVLLFNLQFGPVVMIFVLFGSALLIYGFAQNDLPVFVAIRVSLWSACLVVAIGYTAYWLNIAEVRCLGIAIPIFFFSMVALFGIEVNQVQRDHLRFIGLVGGFGCLLVLVIAVAMGHNALVSMNGQKMPPNMEAAMSAAMSAAMRQFAPAMPTLPGNSGFTPELDPTPQPPEVRLSIGSWSESYQLGQEGYLVYRPDEGKKYIVATVTATNISDDTLTVDSSDFKLTGSDRNLYAACNFLMGIEGVNLLQAEMLPHGSATGTVVFEVDRSVQPVSVEYGKSLF